VLVPHAAVGIDQADGPGTARIHAYDCNAPHLDGQTDRHDAGCGKLERPSVITLNFRGRALSGTSLSDNVQPGPSSTSVLFAETAARLGIVRKRTRRYRPQTNGKVERFHRTLLEEWAYGRLYRSNDERCRAFAGGCASTITADYTPRSMA
jgi:hypothetical protein